MMELYDLSESIEKQGYVRQSQGSLKSYDELNSLYFPLTLAPFHFNPVYSREGNLKKFMSDLI